MATTVLHLYDPRRGDPALRVETFGSGETLEQPQRFNLFTLLWLQEGSGTFWADLNHYPFRQFDLLFFVPYQTLKLSAEAPVSGYRIQFHANFFCIETHHEEVGCNGVLFNDPGGPPLVHAEPEFRSDLSQLITSMQQELQERGLAHTELLLSYLKILLVRASRIKLEQQGCAWEPAGKQPALLAELRRLIEENFRSLHRPSDYAALLCVTPKTLSKVVSTHLRTTPTGLIRERLMREAKWELLHTLKPVKQISHDLGFADVFYFSRLFKRTTGCSPTFFREYETAIREGRNLSISKSNPSIPP